MWFILWFISAMFTLLFQKNNIKRNQSHVRSFRPDADVTCSDKRYFYVCARLKGHLHSDLCILADLQNAYIMYNISVCRDHSKRVCVDALRRQHCLFQDNNSNWTRLCCPRNLISERTPNVRLTSPNRKKLWNSKAPSTMLLQEQGWIVAWNARGLSSTR